MDVTPPARLESVPPGLARALEEREAVVTSVEHDPPKVYARFRSPEGGLFCWYTTDGSQRDVCAYETAVRELVADRGALGAPRPLAVGDAWRLEREIVAEPISGPAVDAVVEAAGTIAALELPPRPASVAREGRVAKVRRRLRVAASGLSPRDAVRARRLLAGSRLPRTTAHGDFFPGHVLPAGGRVWVIDWELNARRPAGYDLMTLWAHLSDEGDRARLFEGAVDLVGPAHREELLRLRYAVAVLTAATKVGEPLRRYNDYDGARALRARLPELRADASGEG